MDLGATRSTLLAGLTALLALPAGAQAPEQTKSVANAEAAEAKTLGPEYAGARVEARPGAPTAVALVHPADGLSKKAAADAEHIFAVRMDYVDRLAGVDVEAKLRGAAPAPGAAALERAREKYQAGKSAYENLDLEGAVAAFQDAIQAFSEAVVARYEMAELAETFTFLGATHFLSGESTQAQEAFRHAVLLDRQYRPDATVFPPSLIEAFDSARWEVQAAPRGVLTVTSTPDASQVWVDGRYRGITPLTLETLPVGSHYVVVRRWDSEPATERSEIAPADPSTVNLTLRGYPDRERFRELVKRAAGEVGPPEMPESVRELATFLGVQRVIVGRVATKEETSTLSAVTYDVATGRRVVEEQVEFVAGTDASRNKITGFAHQFLPKSAVEVAPLEAVEPFEVPEWVSDWRVWAGVGTAAAIVAGTAIALSAAGNPAAPPDRSGSLITLGIP